MKKDHMDLLNKAISYSIALEDQETAPRYDWETVDRIIKSSKIYDIEKTALLINNAKAVLEIVKKTLRRYGLLNIPKLRAKVYEEALRKYLILDLKDGKS